MSLHSTPVYRNLRVRVTFMGLEYEDLAVVLLIAPVSFFVGSLFERELFGIPMKLLFEWGVPAIASSRLPCLNNYSTDPRLNEASDFWSNICWCV